MPLVLLLLHIEHAWAVPSSAPADSGGQGPTHPWTGQPWTGCGRWTTTTVWHLPYPGIGWALPPPTPSPAWHPVAPPRTHVVGVEHQRMGTAPVPCPKGDARAGFLAQGEQSQAQGRVPLAAGVGGEGGGWERVPRVPAPRAPGSRAPGGRCAAAGQWHHGSGSASAGGPSAHSLASPAAVPAGSCARPPGPPGPSLPAAALGKPGPCKTRHRCCQPGSNPMGHPSRAGSPSRGAAPPSPLTP